MKKGKIFCLMGKSSVGKTSVENLLCQNGLRKAVTYTTRPMRISSNEIDGKDYHFITNNEFEELIKYDRLVEHRVFNNWYYGLGVDEIDLSKGSWVIVVDLKGLKSLQEYYGKENVIGIYLYADDRERLMRSLLRDKNGDVKEIIRRFIADEEDFSDEKIKGNYILRINNYVMTDTVNIILRNFANDIK